MQLSHKIRNVYIEIVHDFGVPSRPPPFFPLLPPALLAWERRIKYGVPVFTDPRAAASSSHGFRPREDSFFWATADMADINGTVATPILYPLRPVFLGLR